MSNPTGRWEDEHVDDGERFDHPVPRRRYRRAIQAIAALLLAVMLFTGGPAFWIIVLTALCLLSLWFDWGSRNRDDEDDRI